MKIVKLKGGMGNQMFQYAFGKLIEEYTGDVVKIDLSSYNDLKDDKVRKPRIQKYNLSLPVADDHEIKKLCMFNHFENSQSNKYRVKIALESVLNSKYFFERNHSGCNKLKMKKVEYFDGYWQNWEYVDEIMDKLEHDFVPIESISDKGSVKLKEIENCESVFVGVRRGDYLTVKPKHYGCFGKEYYRSAMEQVSKLVDNPVFYIFSNDIEWVEKNMDFKPYNVRYIKDTIDDFDDFILMTKCKHSIITNSTYHWWGARRYEYPGKVIVAPKQWFADNAYINIVPDRWVRI